MKKLLALFVTGTLLLGGISLAETNVQATFYDGIPSSTGSVITDDFGQPVEATLVSHAIGEKIYHLEAARYVSLAAADNNFVFKIYGGDTTNEMDLVSTTNTLGSTTITLGEITNAFDGALNSDLQLAIFSNDDGVVTGFYTFIASDLPTVSTTDAVTLTLVSKAGVSSYQTVDQGTVKLENVTILQGSSYVPLYRVMDDATLL